MRRTRDNIENKLAEVKNTIYNNMKLCRRCIEYQWADKEALSNDRVRV